MAVHNADIAAAFEEIADLLELGDENPFRIRAYRNAARVVGGLSLDLAVTLAAGKDLPKLPGIGADLAGKIHEIAATGTCKLLQKLRAGRRIPARLLGVSLSSLAQDPLADQLALFVSADPLSETDRDRVLARAVDRVREKFGPGGIIPASLSHE